MCRASNTVGIKFSHLLWSQDAQNQQRSIHSDREQTAVAEARYAFGRKGVEPRIALLASLRCLGYGQAGPHIGPWLDMGRTTTDKYLRRSCKELKEAYGSLLEPWQKWRRAIRVNEAAHSLPGMLGSIDCTHFWWHSCPMALRALFSGRDGSPSFVLEAVCDHGLYIHHRNFGNPGSNNDVTVLNMGPIPGQIKSGDYPTFYFDIAAEL